MMINFSKCDRSKIQWRFVSLPSTLPLLWNMEVMAEVSASGAFKQFQRWELHTENSGTELSTIIQSTTVLNKNLLHVWMHIIAITVGLCDNSPTELDTENAREIPRDSAKILRILNVEVIRGRVMFGYFYGVLIRTTQEWWGGKWRQRRQARVNRNYKQKVYHQLKTVTKKWRVSSKWTWTSYHLNPLLCKALSLFLFFF